MIGSSSDRPDDDLTAALFEIVKTHLDRPDCSMSTALVDLEFDTCHAIMGDVIGMVAAEPEALERLTSGPTLFEAAPDFEGQTVGSFIKLLGGWINAARRPIDAPRRD